MRSPKDIPAIEYTYELPEGRIAQFPVTPKHASKLLVYKNGSVHETVFRNITEEIETNSLVVFNNTKVVQARLIFEKETGGKIEIFCLQPAHGQLWQEALTQKRSTEMECLVGGISKWKTGPLRKEIILKNETLVLTARYVSDLPNSKLIELQWDKETLTLAEVLELAGETPLPPYLQRKAETRDKLEYQTYYAEQEGSVAAPTAGLHFTEEVFADLEKKKVQKLFVTLHVGAGTFKPIKSDTLSGHEMHKEWLCITKQQIEALLQNKNQTIAVGTTSLRFLESIYWLGVALHHNPLVPLSKLELKQWDAYETKIQIPKENALQLLLNKMAHEKLEEFYAQTQILIAPGYQFKMADGLITNFHQPGSTLLLLVAAAIGDDWKKVYQYALENNFRFLSYGDSSLLWIKKN